MADTALTLITKAMQALGVLTKTEPPDADEANDGLDALNNLLDSWSNESMLCVARMWETFPLVSAQSLYTIGAGGNFNTVRPIKIAAAMIKQNNYEYPVIPLPDETFVQYISDKTTPGMPGYLNLDNAYPVGNLRVWPVPNTTYDLFLLTEKLITSFATLYQTVILPPGWKRALIYNLAIELSPVFNQAPTEALVALAKDSKGAIMRAIISARTLDAVPLAGNRQFDIIAGQ